MDEKEEGYITYADDGVTIIAATGKFAHLLPLKPEADPLDDWNTAIRSYRQLYSFLEHFEGCSQTDTVDPPATCTCGLYNRMRGHEAALEALDPRRPAR